MSVPSNASLGGQQLFAGPGGLTYPMSRMQPQIVQGPGGSPQLSGRPTPGGSSSRRTSPGPSLTPSQPMRQTAFPAMPPSFSHSPSFRSCGGDLSPSLRLVPAAAVPAAPQAQIFLYPVDSGPPAAAPPSHSWTSPPLSPRSPPLSQAAVAPPVVRTKVTTPRGSLRGTTCARQRTPTPRAGPATTADTLRNVVQHQQQPQPPRNTQQRAPVVSSKVGGSLEQTVETSGAPSGYKTGLDSVYTSSKVSSSRVSSKNVSKGGCSSAEVLKVASEAHAYERGGDLDRLEDFRRQQQERVRRWPD